MYFKITVQFLGSIVEYPICDELTYCLIRTYFLLADYHFPEEIGYELTIHKVGSSKPPISRTDFFRLLARCGDDKLIDAFCHADEFEAFLRLKRSVDRETEEQEVNYIEHTRDEKVNNIFQYADKFFIFETEPRMGQPSEGHQPYLIIWRRIEYRSPTLEKAEQFLYRLYLTGGFWL